MSIAYRQQWLIVKKQPLITRENYWIPCIMSTIGEKAILDQVQCVTLVPNLAGPPIVLQDFVVNGVA